MHKLNKLIIKKIIPLNVHLRVACYQEEGMGPEKLCACAILSQGF